MFDHGRAMEPYWNYNSSEQNRSNVYRQDPDTGKWNWYTFNASELETIRAACSSFLRARQAVGEITNNYHLCGKGYIFSNKWIPKPPKKTVFIDDSFKSGSGLTWHKAKSDKTLIVVNPYMVRKGTIEAEATFESTGKNLGYYQDVHVTAMDLVTYGFLKEHPLYPGRANMLGGACSFYVQVNIDIFSDGMYKIRDISSLSEALKPLWEEKIDTGLVTNTIAKADVACMDVLTTLAEMPETVRSIVNGFNAVSSLVKSAKRKEFSLTKAHEKLKEQRAKGYIGRLSSLEKERSLATHPKRVAAIDRKITRTRKAYLKAMRDSAKELADAISGVWLNFRYNIMPIVYTVDDINELLASFSATYKTARGFTTSEREIEFDDLVVKSTVSEKCMIKRLLNPELQFSSLTSANFISTGYQLIPYTFVLDWFINAGDYITSLTSPSYALKEGSTYSTKSVIKFTDPTVKINIQSYIRTPITPENHRGISLQFDMSAYRYMDAAALLWNQVKSRLIHSKRN